jgi:hypothetical protein
VVKEELSVSVPSSRDARQAADIPAAIVDLGAPIIPGESLAGLRLRTPIGRLERTLQRFQLADDLKLKLQPVFEASYRVAGGAVGIAVDVRNGKIFRITARAGYKGCLFDQIRVRMRVREAFRLEPRLYYSEAEELILCRDVPGLSLDVSAVDPLPAAVPDLTIAAINVLIPELDSLQAQNGNW